jgi:hypothetical protein
MWESRALPIAIFGGFKTVGNGNKRRPLKELALHADRLCILAQDL